MHDGLATPLSFERRYGTGCRRALVLGGGGLFFVAWQVAYLDGLIRRGVPVPAVDRLVGTSAGSIVASVLASGGLSRFATEVGLLARFPGVASVLSPTGVLHPSQQRALDLFLGARDSHPETVRSIGHGALAASTPPSRDLRRNIGLMIASRRWPMAALHITATDAYSAERLVFTSTSAVSPTRAAAASSSVPGIFSPQRIRDRRCMDGGVSGSGTHCDLVAGADDALVLALSEALTGDARGAGGMTQEPDGFDREIESLRRFGTRVITRGPEAVDMARLMEPSAVPDAVAMGERQAQRDARELRAAWSS